MSEYPISISNLNDFVFCPVSIYFHAVESDTEKLTYQDSFQINGSAAHERSDTGAYSTQKDMLQGISVYCEKYDLSGKIDTFDIKNGILTERKKRIKTVYDGYVFQLYAQYFALQEMGYSVSEIRLYSMDDNKTYSIEKPEDAPEMFKKFEKLVNDLGSFEFENFVQTNSLKCKMCIYEPLCSFSALKVIGIDNAQRF